MQQQLFAGVDWATTTHAACVVDQHGGIRARFEIPNTGKTFTGLVRRLAKLEVAGVAIERPDGPLVAAMLDADLKVVVVTHGPSKRCAAATRRLGPKVTRATPRCWLTPCAPTGTGWPR